MNADSPGIFKSATGAIVHRKLLIAAILVLFLGGGAALYKVTPHTYQAQAKLYVDPTADQALQQADGLLSAFYVQQATSQKILQRAADRVGGGATATGLAPRLTVAAIKGTTIIGIKATASTADGAALVANKVAQAVVDQNHADAGGKSLSQQYLSDELKRLTAQIQQDSAPGAPLEQQLADRQQYALTYQRLQDTYLQAAKKTDSVSVLEQALPPAAPANPNLVRYLAVAAAAGLCVSVLLALLVERLDDRIMDNNGLAQAAGTPLVIAVPKSSLALPLGLPEPFSLAYAHLSARYPKSRSFMVVAASDRESAEDVAEALAMAATRTGTEAIVLHGGTVIQRLATNEPEIPTHRPWRPGGGRPKDESAGLQPRLTALSIASQLEPAPELEEERYDKLTFVAVPAPFLSPMAVIMADNVDGAVIVAVSRSTRVSDIARTAELLRKVGVEPLAGILIPKESATAKTSKAQAARNAA